MALRATHEAGEPRLVQAAYWGTSDPNAAPVPVQAVYSPEDDYQHPVFQRAGAPELSLSLDPATHRSDAAQAPMRIRVGVSGVNVSGAALTVIPNNLVPGPGGLIATFPNQAPGQVATQTFQTPVRNARFVLQGVNVNLIPTVVSADYWYGLPPRIVQWAVLGYRQGIAGHTPDQALLAWNVADASPPADVDVIPGIHYHPGRQQSGRYWYSRVGARTMERLTLSARNVFATVMQTLTLRWT